MVRYDETGTELEDRELVDRARSGDDRALDHLVSRHYRMAYRVALGITRDPELAADAAQDGFLKAVDALDRFRGESRFRTWLITIVSNEARGALRKRNRRRESVLNERAPVADGGGAVDEGVVVADEARRARALLDTLPEKQRLAIVYRLDEGLSFREVGEAIGSSEGAARVNYHHGIRRLRELMRES